MFVWINYRPLINFIELKNEYTNFCLILEHKVIALCLVINRKGKYFLPSSAAK
jgi:hypothetical protein